MLNLYCCLLLYTCRPYIFIGCGTEHVIGMTLDGMISLLNSTTFSLKLFFHHENFAPLHCLISMMWLFLEMNLNFTWACHYHFVILRLQMTLGLHMHHSLLYYFVAQLTWTLKGPACLEFTYICPVILEV